MVLNIKGIVTVYNKLVRRAGRWEGGEECWRKDFRKGMPLNSTYVQFVYHIFTCMKSPSLILNVMATGTVNNMLSRQAGRGSGGGWREKHRAGGVFDYCL